MAISDPRLGTLKVFGVFFPPGIAFLSVVVANVNFRDRVRRDAGGRHGL